MENEYEKVSKEYFRSLGFRYIKKTKLISYINLQFLIYNDGKESIAIYTLNERKESIHNVLEGVRHCSQVKPSIRICLCIPVESYLPADLRLKIENTNIEIYTIKEGILDCYLKANDIKILESLKIEDLKKLLKNINLISSNYLRFNLFKIDNSLLNKLNLNVSSEKDFTYQAQILSSILESLDYKSIKNEIKFTKKEEKELKEGHSISVIVILFKKKKLNCDKGFEEAIKELRNLRDLRNMPPNHPSSGYKKVCKLYINKQIPKTSADWKKLSQITLSRFQESLLTIKGRIIGK
ncbi:MAG: hypothetical protein PHD81_01735 [Candidatus Nanoarchaeia archaeon]|nr:hypothetical protein [Candidatus Nanoarchaeia archaeon]MDD5587810.1 hypothetical protein [Candidatus Nanoarchaeia archaeon]